MAAIDALIWPVALMVLLSHLPVRTGVAGPTLTGVLMLFAALRLHRAVYCNHRYRFTTWRVARVLAVLLVIGIALKVGLH
jgi:hypothetical protein